MEYGKFLIACQSKLSPKAAVHGFPPVMGRSKAVMNLFNKHHNYFTLNILIFPVIGVKFFSPLLQIISGTRQGLYHETFDHDQRYKVPTRDHNFLLPGLSFSRSIEPRIPDHYLPD
jgi:hypothetical protein